MVKISRPRTKFWRFFAIILATTLTACGDSVDYESEEFEIGSSEVYAEGVNAAIACIRIHGGGAQDAADYCDSVL